MNLTIKDDRGALLGVYANGALTPFKELDKRAIAFELMALSLRLMTPEPSADLENFIVDVVKRHFGGASYGGPLSGADVELDQGTPAAGPPDA